MGKSARKLQEDPAQYCDRRGVLGGLDARPVEFALEEELRLQILRGARTRRLQNVSTENDPCHGWASRS